MVELLIASSFLVDKHTHSCNGGKYEAVRRLNLDCVQHTTHTPTGDA